MRAPTRDVRRMARSGTRVLAMVVEALAAARESALASGLSRRERARHSAERLHAASRRLARIHALRIEVTGRRPAPGSILAANHVSYMDAIAIASLVPCVAVAKAEAMTWPVLGAALVELGVLFVERGCAFSGARLMMRAERILDAGASILVFPEGTTSTGEDVRPFRRGMFAVAKRTRAPVVPVAIEYVAPEAPWVGGDPFVPHYLRTCHQDEIHVRLWFGPPLTAAPGRAAEELAHRARDAVREHLGNAQPAERAEPCLWS